MPSAGSRITPPKDGLRSEAHSTAIKIGFEGSPGKAAGQKRPFGACDRTERRHFDAQCLHFAQAPGALDPEKIRQGASPADLEEDVRVYSPPFWRPGRSSMGILLAIRNIANISIANKTIAGT